MHKEVSVRTPVRSPRKAILLENMIYLILIPLDDLLSLLSRKLEIRIREQSDYEKIAEHVRNSVNHFEEINVNLWCRANNAGKPWKHLVADALEQGRCEVYYKPRGVYIPNIAVENYKWTAPSQKNEIIPSFSGHRGRRFYYKAELILQVVDQVWIQ